MQKILIIGPAWIGDMVMAQTLFKLLKGNCSDVILHVLAPPWTLPVLQFMPEVDAAFPLPFKHGELKLKERYKIAQTLKATDYAQAIILPNSFKSALIPFFAKIPKRTGWLREGRALLINDGRKLDKTKYPLMIERFAALAFEKRGQVPADLPNPELVMPDDQATLVMQKYGLTKAQTPVLGLCPGAEYGAAKRWPAAYFAAVAQDKIRAGWQVWLFGGKNDEACAREIQKITQGNCVDLIGKTNLTEAIALLAQTDFVVSNDTGLMHIAAALQRKLVVIYGSSSPGFTPPLTTKATVLSLQLPCSPCFQRTCPKRHCNCLHQLSPDLVLAHLQ